MDVLVFDIGNTRIKVGLFSNGKLQSVKILSENQLPDFVKKHSSFKLAFSNVSRKQILDKFKGFFSLEEQVILPFKMLYETPDSLGKDRICNAAALSCFYPNRNKICIDIGTCVKFDFVDSLNRYHGGSISPGLRLRYEALYEKTENLPLIKNGKEINFLGSNTIDSIRSGVHLGLLKEIEGFISVYEQKFEDMLFVITGGDLKHFDLEQKNSIFADENFTLKGLYQIYKLNES